MDNSATGNRPHPIRFAAVESGTNGAQPHRILHYWPNVRPTSICHIRTGYVYRLSTSGIWRLTGIAYK